jgi:uncharacterized membrane protein
VPRDGTAIVAAPAWDGPAPPGFHQPLSFAAHRRSDGLVALVERRGTEVTSASALDRDSARKLASQLLAAIAEG